MFLSVDMRLSAGSESSGSRRQMLVVLLRYGGCSSMPGDMDVGERVPSCHGGLFSKQAQK